MGDQNSMFPSNFETQAQQITSSNSFRNKKKKFKKHKRYVPFILNVKKNSTESSEFETRASPKFCELKPSQMAKNLDEGGDEKDGEDREFQDLQ